MLDALDRPRTRWRAVRQALRLVDPLAAGFALAGLATRFAADPRVRLLILPADPEAWLVEFDDEFWAWWLQDWPDPVAAQQTQWGEEGRPTGTAALHLRYLTRDRRWETYLVRELACRLGAWLEDVWGKRVRRFPACRGELAGQFDRTRYRWYRRADFGWSIRPFQVGCWCET